MSERQDELARRPRRPDAGVVAVVVALLIGALGAFLALVMNVARAYDTRAQLLAAADSAALAGALELDGDASATGGIRRSRIRAYDYLVDHGVERSVAMRTNAGVRPTTAESPVRGLDEDLVPGCWDLNDNATPASKGTEFVPYGESGCGEPRDVNAVRVKNGRDATGNHNTPLPSVFGSFVSSTEVNVRSEAVAVGGGICSTGCAAPFALADCQVVDPGTGGFRCGPANLYTTRPSGSDSIGLIDPANPGSNPSTPDVATSVRNGCVPSGASSYNTGNGNNINQQIVDAMADTGFVDRIWTVPVLAMPGCPSNPDFGRTGTTYGFAQVRIHRVCCNGNSGCDLFNASISPPPPPCTSADRASILMEVLCTPARAPGRAGCRVYNTSSTDVRIVR
jgi:hypothetical protein